MGIFSGQNNSGEGALRGTENAKLSYTNDAGTNELRSFIASTIVQNAPVHHLDRIVKYQLYWKFYEGLHWRQYNETFISMNYTRAIVNKVNSFLLGPKGFSLEVINEFNNDIDPNVNSKSEALFNYIWRLNGGVKKQSEILQMGSVTGDVWLMPQYVKHPLTGENYMQILCPDSRHCYPQFRNGDVDDLESFMIRQPLEENERTLKLKVTVFTKDKITTWFQKNTVFSTEQAEKIDKETTDNPYDFIPVIHIQNRFNSSSYYGFSDLADILKLNKVYNELAQMVKEIIDYYTVPTTIITGGTVKSITKGIGRIFSGLPAEANVFNLSLGEDLNGTLQYMQEVIKMAIHELSDVPENALGKLQPISNTSAAALQVTYQPLIQQADTKSITYTQGIIELHDMMIRMMRKVNDDNPLFRALPKNFETEHNVQPVWVYGLPMDMTTELQNAETEIRIGIDSRENIMNRLGKKNVTKLIPKIDTDKKAQLLMQAEVEAKAFGNNNPE